MMRISLLAAIAAAAMTIQSAAVLAKEPGDWIIRAGVGYIDPQSNNGKLDGTDLDINVDTATGFIFDVSYMLSQNWAVELLASAPFKHDISIQTLGDVGSTKHLPPTLSGQYHFNPIGRVQPYVGLGFNLTLFSDEKTRGALAGTSLKLDNSFGIAAQAGMDIELTDKVYLNAVVRYIDIETDAKVNGTKVAKVKINPMVYGLNVGYRF